MSDMFHQYQLFTQLARSTSSRLYLAAKPDAPDKKVVLKVFDSLRLHGGQGYTRFLNEVEMLKQLSHPNLLPLLDAGVEKYHPYLIYPQAHQGSLADILRQTPSGRLPINEAVQLISQIGQGLSAAHQRNIFHGNIKPENILFETPGRPQLTDFRLTSLAKHLVYRLDTRSASYMSPEQFAGEVSAASDQYALGCLAYELFTGRIPFSALAISTLRTRHGLEKPVPMCLFVPDLPSYIELAVLKALSKEPADRHEDITSFISALVVGSLPPQLFTALVQGEEGLAVEEQPNIVEGSVEPIPVAAGMTPPSMPAVAYLPSVSIAVKHPVPNPVSPLPEPNRFNSARPPVSKARHIHKSGQIDKVPARLWLGAIVAVVLIFSMVMVPFFLTRSDKTVVPTGTPTPRTPLAIATANGSPTVEATATLEGTPSQRSQAVPTPTPVPTTVPTAVPTSQPTQGPQTPSITLLNASFESPTLGSGKYTYAPADAGWTFTSQSGSKGSGVSRNDSSFTNTAADAPDGRQVAFIQGQGSLKQSLTLPAGSYRITFRACQPDDSFGTQSLQISIDGQFVQSVGLSSHSYSTYTSNKFTVTTTGTHTLQFIGQSGWSQSVALLDNIVIVPA
jgi:serine/threonine protein kinase